MVSAWLFILSSVLLWGLAISVVVYGILSGGVMFAGFALGSGVFSPLGVIFLLQAVLLLFSDF